MIRGNPVLIVEDGPHWRRILSDVCDKVSMPATATGTLSEAGEVLAKGEFRLVILDLLFPEEEAKSEEASTNMSGIGVFVAVLAQRFPKVGVLVLSASDLGATIQARLNSRAIRAVFLKKGHFTATDLVDSICQLSGSTPKPYARSASAGLWLGVVALLLLYAAISAVLLVSAAILKPETRIYFAPTLTVVGALVSLAGTLLILYKVKAISSSDLKDLFNRHLPAFAKTSPNKSLTKRATSGTKNPRRIQDP